MECTKVKFSTQDYALFHIKKHKKRNADKSLEARAYKCVYCTGWHITSKLLNSELIQDNEQLKAQLIDQIKQNQNLKAEIKILATKLKVENKVIINKDPFYEQLKHQINIKNKRIKELTDIRNDLIAKLNQLL